MITISGYGGHSARTCYWCNSGTSDQDYTGPKPIVTGYNQPVMTPALHSIISTTVQQ